MKFIPFIPISIGQVPVQAIIAHIRDAGGHVVDPFPGRHQISMGIGDTKPWDFHCFKTWASTGILGDKEQAKFI